MKFLTLHQPWASLVAIGAKRIETRSWATSYRGRLGICAAQAFPLAKHQLLCWQPPFAQALVWAGIEHPDMLPRGAVVAVVDLTECERIDPAMIRLISDREMYGHEVAFGNFTPGRWAWTLENLVALACPIPCKGSHRLWDDEDLAMQVRASLGENIELLK